MSPIEVLVLALLGAVLVGRLRSPLARGPVPRTPRASSRWTPAPRTPRGRVTGSAGQPTPRAA